LEFIVRRRRRKNIMTDSASPSVPAAKAASPKKAKVASKKPMDHPPVANMVNDAIKALKERGGSSSQAIKKYIAANNKCDVEKLAPFIKRYLKSAVAKGGLVQTKGKGASGSFKLKDKAVATKPKKAAAPKKKAAAGEKKPKTPKKKKAAAAAKKPAGEKKPKTPKKKKAPAAKKSAKKSTKPKTPKKPKAVKKSPAKKAAAKKPAKK
jgi:histone H1/5